jgi:hypothetical protein
MAKSVLTGFREASRQLGNMRRAAAQGVGRRALLVPAGILRDEMIARVKVLTGDTQREIAVEPAKASRGRPQVAVVSRGEASVSLEFGNPAPGHTQHPQPFARPSLDAKEGAMLNAFGPALKSEVDKTVIRAARKAAKG